MSTCSPAHRKPPYDARYMLRLVCLLCTIYDLMTFCWDSPQTVESLFLAYRLTGDEKYRTYGWDIFQSIEKYARVETGGYATILNVEDVNSKLEDRMETFFLVRLILFKVVGLSTCVCIERDVEIFVPPVLGFKRPTFRQYVDPTLP